MPKRSGIHLQRLIILICLLLCSPVLFAQTTTNPTSTLPGQTAPQKDTSKTNTKKWKDVDAKIFFKKLNSEKTYTPDTSLHTFHRRPFSQPWYRDMGNLGSPVNNMLFTPEDRLGPSLGYHVFDVYRFFVDSLNYYNTTRPYTDFSYQLGSKLEQMAEIMHTQNITPYWNFSVDYRKINAPGFYQIQRNNHDNANFTTNYTSKSQHYQLFAAMVYNKEQHDENGGVTNDSELLDPNYNDRKTVDVLFQNPTYSTTRSTVTNVQRDFTVMLQHSYSWGHGDTLYNSDSSSYTYKFVPRFRITHKMELSTEKHDFKDMTPDSANYAFLFDHTFANGGQINVDSVYSQQKWFWIDNRILLNGFLGKEQKQLDFNVGIGNRIDEFATDYITGINRNNITSNYLVGEIKKEALQPGQWFYQGNAQFYMTGADAGDFLLHAELGKDLKNNWGGFVAGFQQQLNSAPYNDAFYANQYYQLSTSFNKESVTQLYVTLNILRLRLSAGVRNYVMDNYIYIDQAEKPAQDAAAFNMLQVWVRKEFRLGNFVLDNEYAYQQAPSDAPVNVPTLLGRNQLSYESFMFHHNIKIAVGVEVRYNTAYYAPGYDPYFNRFYYQDSYYISNYPQGSVFFNFRIKRFRAFIMGDQLQELLTMNTITSRGYPAPDAMIRFGFSWVMIN